MRIPRIYQPVVLTSDREFKLGDTASQYVLRVLRLRESDSLFIFDGKGACYQAELTGRAGKHATVRLLHQLEHDAESPLQLHVGLGISKGERMDYAIQKLVEIGVQDITPLLTDYTVVKLDEKRRQSRHQHWEGVIISACEQSGRNYLPRLHEINDLPTWISTRDEECRLVFDAGGTCRLSEVKPVPTRVNILIGPEGGLSDTEFAQAGEHGFISIRLGPRILRTETAAVAIGAALQTLWGDYSR